MLKYRNQCFHYLMKKMKLSIRKAVIQRILVLMMRNMKHLLVFSKDILKRKDRRKRNSSSDEGSTVQRQNNKKKIHHNSSEGEVLKKETKAEVQENNSQHALLHIHIQNGSNCGIFACKVAEYLSRETSLSFGQEDMAYYRKRMVWEIIKNQLLSP